MDAVLLPGKLVDKGDKLRAEELVGLALEDVVQARLELFGLRRDLRQVVRVFRLRGRRRDLLTQLAFAIFEQLRVVSDETAVRRRSTLRHFPAIRLEGATLFAVVVGLLVGGFVANLAVSWHRISSFEGGSGYFVIGMALLGFIGGAIVGVIPYVNILLGYTIFWPLITMTAPIRRSLRILMAAESLASGDTLIT